MIHQEIPVVLEKIRTEAKLYTYFWENSKELYDGRRRPVVIICPGGAYRMTSDREAESLAIKFMEMGCHAAVLRYSVAPQKLWPKVFLELGWCVKTLRERADEWYIEPDKIIVQGSSAGGHLAAGYSSFWKEEWMKSSLHVSDAELLRPNGQILSYPVISSGEYGHRESFCNLCGEKYDVLKEKVSLEKQVSDAVPPTFIWHTFEDTTVPAENAMLYARALREHGIVTEFHLFPRGGHGLGSADGLGLSEDGRGFQKECAVWMKLVRPWIENLPF